MNLSAAVKRVHMLIKMNKLIPFKCFSCLSVAA